jgi:hypothetical protein
MTKHLVREDIVERFNYPLHHAVISLVPRLHSWLGAGPAHQLAVQGSEVFGSLHKARRFRVPIRAGLCPLLTTRIVSLLAAAAGIGRGGVVVAVDVEFIIALVVALAAG